MYQIDIINWYTKYQTNRRVYIQVTATVDVDLPCFVPIGLPFALLWLELREWGQSSRRALSVAVT